VTRATLTVAIDPIARIGARVGSFVASSSPVGRELRPTSPSESR
jgi:hypothetical protein